MLQIETDFGYEGQPVYQLSNPNTGELTATVYEDYDTARLIAAAPRLLRTCRALLTLLEDVYEDDFYRHGAPSEDAWPAMLADARQSLVAAEGQP